MCGVQVVPYYGEYYPLDDPLQQFLDHLTLSNVDFCNGERSPGQISKKGLRKGSLEAFHVNDWHSDSFCILGFAEFDKLFATFDSEFLTL